MNHKGVTIGGKHYTVYEASQLMRQLEAKVRQQKDIANLAKLTGDDKLRREAQAKIVALKAQYKAVSEASGLKQRAERMVVEGYRKNKSVAKYQKDGIIESGNGGSAVTINSIDSPIEQRHTGKGNPNAILHFDIELNNRQQMLLDALPEYNSRATVSKGDVSMTDLSALTAKTGDEFAMFTKEGTRLIVRGNGFMVEITPEEANALGKDGYVWSGHTHPGTDMNVLQPSSGDYAILNQFQQENSAIYNSVGAYL